MKSFIWKGLSIGLLLTGTAFAQSDTAQGGMNMDAVYERPFLLGENGAVSLGGYLETNLIYAGVDGVNEGLSFQARRLTFFTAAQIAPRLSFLSEMEYEDGTKEIAIEYAALDLAIHPSFNLRGGIVMNPIGAFNQNHDGPKWEFIERPDMAVHLLPATFSNAGFGVFGKYRLGQTSLGYEAYITNGFDQSIIDNEEGRTFLPAVKESLNRFEESASGLPMYTVKVSAKNRKVGELGLSYMGGTYNTFQADGLVLDKQRRVHVFAMDFNTTIERTGTFITGEIAKIHVEVPRTYAEEYGSNQLGYFIDIVQPVYAPSIQAWPNAQVLLAARIDYVDWNQDEFPFAQGEIGDEILGVTGGISFRPVPQTVFRLNYRYQKQTDLLRNPPAIGGGLYVGLSTYF